MERFATSAIGAIAALAVSISDATAACDMPILTHHGDSNQTPIYAATSGVHSIYYKSNLDVNTDGTARSYHPDDPRADTLAFNNIANAIGRIFDEEGNDITCSPRRGACFTRFITTFEAARDAQFNPDGHPRITTPGVIPWRHDEALGWDVPCVIPDGDYEGYFVSQTAWPLNPALDECDVNRYLDALTVKANVLPLGTSWKSMGVVTDGFDLVVVRDRVTREIAYAVNGDRGPADILGEGSIALAADLESVTLQGDETYDEIKDLARADVEYLIFPKADIIRLAGRDFTQSDIDSFGEATFEQWGGVERLDACSEM